MSEDFDVKQRTENIYKRWRYECTKKISDRHSNEDGLRTRSRLIDEFTILGLIEKGWLTGPNVNPFGMVGIIVNCPIAYRFL